MSAELGVIRDQLLADRQRDWAIFSSEGKVLEAQGFFGSTTAGSKPGKSLGEERVRLAHTLLQLCNSLMKAGEKFKRITVNCTENVEYIATVCVLQNKPHGVVVRLQR